MRLLAISVTVPLLSGCPPGPDFSTRDCSMLTFDHPAADLWAPYAEGDRLDFTGPNAAASYTVVDVDTPVPEGAAERGSVPTGEIGCVVEKIYTMRSEDGAHEFVLGFIQGELADLPPAEEKLSLVVRTPLSRTPSVVLTFIHLVPLDDTGRFTDADVTFEERGEVGGTAYDDLYSTRFSGAGLGELGAGEVRLEGLSLSRGTGLVALDRSDVGELYLVR